MISEHVIVGFVPDNKDTVEYAKRLVDKLMKVNKVGKNTRVSVVVKKPGKKPKIISTVDKRPSKVVAEVKKIPVSKPVGKKGVPDLVNAVKKFVKNPKYVTKGVPKQVILITKQNPKNPASVPVGVKKVKTPSTSLTVVPVGRVTLPVSKKPSGITVVPVKPKDVTFVIYVIRRSKY